MTISYFCYGDNIIIDDLVFPDGHTRMGQLGGGSTYAVLGMRIWNQHVGIVSGVGVDFPAALRSHLGSSGVDLEGLIFRDLPTPRAWQILEFDDHRTELFRTDPEQFQPMLPAPTEVPISYRSAVGIHTLDFGDVTLVKKCRSIFPHALLSWEPYILSKCDSANREAILETLPYVDIFLPNYNEVARLCGTDNIYQIQKELHSNGARIVAIRMGEKGSIVSTGVNKIWHIQAYPAKVVDSTGAGNAYCGGFLVGYTESGDPKHAGLCGSVSASFIIEQIGPPIISLELEQEARRRYDKLNSTHV